MDIRQKVYQALRDPANVAILDIVDPWRNHPYPMTQIGPRYRFPEEYTWKNEDGSVGWIDYDAFHHAISAAVPEVAGLFANDAKEIYEAAFDRAAADNYGEEWNTVGSLGG